MRSPNFNRAKDWFKGAIDLDFLRKILGTFLTQVMSICINFISVIYISRALGPIPRGVVATIMAIITLGIQFGNMGLHASNSYFISKDRGNYETAVGNSCVIATLLGGIISICVLASFSCNLSDNSIGLIDMGIIALWIPVGLAYLLFQNILISIHKVKAYNKGEIITKAVGFLAICCFFIQGIKSAHIILIANFTAQILGIAYVWSHIRANLTKQISTSLSFFKQSLFYGFKSYVGCFFVYLVLRVDLLMVKSLMGFEEVGYYSVSTNMADLVVIFPTIVGSLLFPRIVPITDEMQKFAIVKKIALIILGLMLIVCIFAGLLVKVVVVTLLGDAFSPAVPAFLCLLPGLVCLSVNGIFMNYFASIGLPLIVIFSPGLATILNVILNLKMIPAYGINGASIASTISYGGMLIMSFIYLGYRKRRSLLRMMNRVQEVNGDM